MATSRLMLVFVILVVALSACFGGQTNALAASPNVVFFLVDDLGWADLGCYGSSYHETPNIDALCAQGVKFTNAYTAASICSPTRASLMTGKHPVRVGITDWIPGRGDRGQKLVTPEDQHQLALDEFTLSEAFKAGGYRTFYAGKWHLGGPEYSPSHQGFDVYFDPHHDPAKGSPKRRETGRPHDTLGITREALKFLDDNVGNGPVFLYLSYYDVHTPIVADTRFLASLQKKRERLEELEPIVEHAGNSRAQQDNPDYGSMVAAVDDSVGRVLRRLEQLGCDENTIVVFFSDNGGLCTLRKPGPTCNLPLRSGKGWLYEGGIRVPLIIRTPHAVSERVCEQAVISTDLYPTLLELAGLPLRPEQHVDGISLLPWLSGIASPTPRTLYWHYPHYHGSTWTPGAAIRDGDWKLVQFYEDDTVELYNLAEDMGERRDLTRNHPDTTEQLLEKLRDWQQELNAQMPVARQSTDSVSD